MESDEEFYEASQQSQDTGEGATKKKKKKKKSKRNLDEDFANVEDMAYEEGSQLTQEDLESQEPATSTPKKKKKKKKKSLENDEEPAEEEDLNVAETAVVAPQTPGSSSKRSPKKEPVTPAKSSSLPSLLPPSQPKTSDTDERTMGINILAAMSHDDLELLLNKVGAECPPNEIKTVKKREMEIDWTKIAFSCYSADHCRIVWAFLQSQTRKYRIMHELVEEVKFNLKADYQKFMRKSIEAAPNFPKQPYACGGFQCFCMEKWEEHKHLQEKMKKKVENFLIFQTQCHKRWTSLTDEQKEHYDHQAKLLKAEYNQKMKEFYANYPAFLIKKESKLDKDGKPETKEKPMTDHFRKQAVKTSHELFPDAPKFPFTPMQMYINSKLNEIEPPLTAAELPGYKKGLCDKWKESSNKKKLKWIRKCIKASERYQIEVAEYKKTHPLFFLSKELQMSKLISKEEFAIWAEAHGKPPKPKNTIFEYFFEEFQKTDEAIGKPEEELLPIADKKWKEMPKLDRERYSLGFRMQHLNFRKDIEEYMSTVPDMMRACVIDSLPKRFKVEILEKVNKEPLVKDDDLIEVDDDEEGASTSKKRKRTETNGEESCDESRKKKQPVGDPSELPLYVEDLGDEHKQLITKNFSEMKRRKAVEEEQKASNYNPGKNITPQIINEAIRGIFDGRQFERRFTVYYYYAKYIAREKTWCTLYSKIGIVQTAARMIETFHRLSKQEKQVFLDQAIEFHNTLRYYDKKLTKEEEIFAPKLRLFPEEPKPPPRKAPLLYKQEVQVLKLKSPSTEPPPTWEQLDQDSQMLYLKKLYKLHREYIVEYERFVRNMTPNDMIEYLIRQAHTWNSAAANGKSYSYFDHNIYSTATALRNQVSRETYSLEMSEDGQESEPELYSMEDGSLVNGAQKFHYKPNPFSVPKRSRGRPRKPMSLIKKLCSSAKHNNDSDSFSSSSSSSDEEEDHDKATKFGNLVLPDRKKKKMKRFQRKLKKVARYYYPLDEYYEPFDCLKVFKKANEPSLTREDSKREALARITEYEAKWENIRNAINSKPNLPLNLPKHFGKKAFKKATNKTVTAVKGRTELKKSKKQNGKSQKKKKSRVCKKATSTIQKMMLKNAIRLLKDQSFERKRNKKQNQVGLVDAHNSDDEYDDIDDETEDNGMPTTVFIRTAQSVAKSIEKDRQEMSPALESLADSSQSRALPQPPPSPAPRRPGLVLVRRSPSPMKKPFVFKEPGLPVPRKRLSSQSQNEPSSSQSPASSVDLPPITPPTSVIIPQSPRRSQQNDSTDEFQLLDTLADFESGQGIFSESELNQLTDYNY